MGNLPFNYNSVVKKPSVQGIVEVQPQQKLVLLFHGLNYRLEDSKSYIQVHYMAEVLLILIVDPNLLVNYVNSVKIPSFMSSINKVYYHNNYIEVYMK